MRGILLSSSRREIASGFGLCLPERAVRLDDAQCMMLDATTLSILPIVKAPLLGSAFALLPVQLARGCLEGVLQPRVLSVPAGAVGPHQQGAVVSLRQTGQRLTSIPIPALMDGIPDWMRSPRVVGSPWTVIDAQMDRLIARFVVQHSDRGPTVRIRLLQRGVLCEPDLLELGCR